VRRAVPGMTPGCMSGCTPTVVVFVVAGAVIAARGIGMTKRIACSSCRRFINVLEFLGLREEFAGVRSCFLLLLAAPRLLLLDIEQPGVDLALLDEHLVDFRLVGGIHVAAWAACAVAWDFRYAESENCLSAFTASKTALGVSSSVALGVRPRPAALGVPVDL
jgi:hypothetical protein